MSVIFILENLINIELLNAMRAECDANLEITVNRKKDDEQERSCSVDLFETLQIPDDSVIRTDIDSYFAQRWRDERPSASNCSLISTFMIQDLPSILRKVLNWTDVFLFNENYIVKPPSSDFEFRWHTDEREQFKYNFLFFEKGIKCEEYCSTWIALDDCDATNGSLAVCADTTLVSIDCSKLDISESRKRRRSDMEANDLCDFFKETRSVEAALTTTEEIVDKVLSIKAGSAVLFSSRCLHRSPPNTTGNQRRVFYIQHSPKIITGAIQNGIRDAQQHDKQRFPLNFALRCL